MATEFDFANAANWERFYAATHSVDWQTASAYKPIPDLDVTGPFPLNARVIASFATGGLVKPTWKTAGWLYQEVRTGVLVGGLPDAVSQPAARIPLDRVQLHFWQRAHKNYQLRYVVPKWFHTLSIQLWQYTGPITEPDLELIELARIDILRTEAKVDALFKDWNQ